MEQDYEWTLEMEIIFLRILYSLIKSTCTDIIKIYKISDKKLYKGISQNWTKKELFNQGNRIQLYDLV